MKIGVVTFPGSLDDGDAARAVRTAGGEAVRLWHADADLRGVDAVVLPGGFSYGDYLRCGAIARFAPVMEPLVEAATGGLPVLGICNGFQVLCESHLLPGALIRNDHRKFVCRDQGLRVENNDDGVDVGVRRRAGDRRTAEERRGRLRRRRRARSTGSRARAASSCATSATTPTAPTATSPASRNERGNVVGLMPHPEHAVEDADRPEHRRAGVLHLRAEGARRVEISPRNRSLRSRLRGGPNERDRQAGRGDAGGRAALRASWGSRTTSTHGSARSSDAARRSAELAMYSVMWSEHCSYKSLEGAPAAVRREGSADATHCWSASARTPASSTSATAGR